LKTGYINLLKRYGMSNQNTNRFAYMAYIAKDKRSVRQVWKSISEKEDGCMDDEESLRLRAEMGLFGLIERPCFAGIFV